MNDTSVAIGYNEGNLDIKILSLEDEISVHIWKTDDLDTKNKQRVFISGWTTEKTIKYPIVKMGIYSVTVVHKSGKRINSSDLLIDESSFLSDKDQLVKDEIHQQRIDVEHNAQLMQKMYITGSDYIIEALKQKMKRTNLSIYAPNMDAMRIGNMIFAEQFFNGTINISHFLGPDTATLGYKISMTFRSQYVPFREYLTYDTKNDSILVIDSSTVLEEHKRIMSKFKGQGINIILLSELVEEAYINKYVLDPLSEMKHKGIRPIFVKFPVAKDIVNKSDNEVIASKTSIRKLRQDKAKNIFPAALRTLNVEASYMDEVTNGWELDSHIGGFDTLIDSSGQHVNIVHGQRFIPSNNGTNVSEEDTKMFFYGNSVMYGIGTDDNNTLPNLIVQQLQKIDKKYDVQNKANFSMNDYVRGINLMKSDDLIPGDIAIFGSHLTLNDDQISRMGIDYINLQPYYERPHDFGELFLDATHMNENSYKYMAQIIWNHLINHKYI